MCLELAQRWEVEDQRLGQLDHGTQSCRQPIAQLDGAERVETRLHQRGINRHVRQELCCHLTHHHRRMHWHAAYYRHNRRGSVLWERPCE